MNAIIELRDSSGSSGLIQNRPRGERIFKDNAMNFYKKDSGSGVPLIDLGSSLKIMPLSTLEVVGIPRCRIVE